MAYATQESPHEHQQSLLLSRIITNVVRAIHSSLSVINSQCVRKSSMKLSWFSTRISRYYVTTRAMARKCGEPLMQVQEINIQNMNVELVAQMFKNYRSNVLFHLEGKVNVVAYDLARLTALCEATDSLQEPS